MLELSVDFTDPSFAHESILLEYGNLWFEMLGEMFGKRVSE
jgi:hypothetical protein